MKTIIIISDSHNMLPKDYEFWQILDEADYIFHLGDGYSDIEALKQAFGEKLIYVYGNCDSFGGENFKIVDIENVKFLLTHGHKYDVKSDLFDLAFECKYQNVKYGLYGHTHRPQIDELDGITLINPGSIAFTNSYCYITVINNKAVYRIVNR